MYQSMIADWREKKGMGDFAFMTVQLPPSIDYSKDPTSASALGLHRRPDLAAGQPRGSYAHGLRMCRV